MFVEEYIKHTTDEDGKHHSVDDEPAIEFENRKEWYKHGKLHRANGKPAVVYLNGDEEYWVDGVRHREGGEPAIVHANGDKKWFHYGEFIKSEYHHFKQ